MTPDQIAAAFGCFGSPFSVAPAVRATPADQEKALRHLERHGTPTHTGYPFMQLAKATGADYGDVLLAASWGQSDIRESWSDAVGRLPLHVLLRIERLIDIDVYLRGGDHYPGKAP